MSLLKDYLEQNQGIVSAVSLEEFTDGEQKLDVHVSSEPSVDHVVGEVAKAELEQKEIARDCDKVNEGVAAMEQYAALLDRGIENGGLAPETIAGMSVGIEHYNRLLGGDDCEPMIPSLEAFGGSGSRAEGAKNLAKQIMEWLAKAWAVTSRILQQLANKFKEVIQRSGVATRKIAERAGELSKKATDIGSSTLPEDKKTLKVSNASKLMVANTFKGSDFETTTKIAQLLCVKIPSDLTGFVKEVSNKTSGYKPGGGTPKISFESAFTSAFNEGVQGDNRFSKDSAVKRTMVFPGNKAAYMIFPKNASDGAAFLAGQKLDILDVPGVKTEGGSDVEVSVRSPGELKSDAEKVGKIAKIILSNDNVINMLANSYKDLDAAGEKVKTSLKDKDLDKEDQDNLKMLMGYVNAAQRMNNGVTGGISYLIQLLNAQLGLIEKQLAQYPSQQVTTTN